MIVRILSEGQYNLPGAFVDRLNEIDNEIVEVVGDGDRQAFRKLLDEMLDHVRKQRHRGAGRGAGGVGRGAAGAGHYAGTGGGAVYGRGDSAGLGLFARLSHGRIGRNSFRRRSSKDAQVSAGA